MSDLLDQLHELARRFEITTREPTPSRVEVGAMVHEWLKRIGSSPSSAPPWGLSPAAALYGVAVVPRIDMEPRAWRMLDADGDLLGEGFIDLPANFPSAESS